MKPAPKDPLILLSKRANVFYIEHARIMVKEGRLVYLVEHKNGVDRGFNIPDRNTSFLLLGKGTSITDGAVRMLAESGVQVGFCGNGGSPLLAWVDFAFLSPQSEYRPTAYMQSWMSAVQAAEKSTDSMSSGLSSLSAVQAAEKNRLELLMMWLTLSAVQAAEKHSGRTHR